VSTVDPVPLRECILYGLEGGKRVRPLLVMLSCEAAGGNATDALDAAVAVELLHTASLFHDDIMDASDTRRGKQTLHVRFGTSMAILAGDTLTALAFSVLVNMITPRRGEVLLLFSRTFLLLCEGQAGDILSGDRTSDQEHRALVEKKTAKLLEACASMGALLACAEPPVISTMSIFGNRLGMAFQVKDDLIDATASEPEARKSVGVDRRNGRKTFVAMASGVPSQIWAERALRRYTEDACTALLALPPSDAREVLLAQTRGLSSRAW
jgi:geranylgeranyl pyrophosphate synthase